MSRWRMILPPFLALGLNVMIVGCKAINSVQEGPQSDLAGAQVPPEEDFARQGQINDAWLKKVLYSSVDEWPKHASEGCELATLIFELPSMARYVGHAAIAVGDDFYDFGPKGGYQTFTIDLGWDWAKIKTPIRYAKGAGWWKDVDRVTRKGERYWADDIKSSDQVTFDKVATNLEKLASNQTVIYVPIELKPEHGRAIREYWRDLYSKMPEYRIPGLHCTSSVIKSFESGDPDTASSYRKVLGQNVWAPELTSPASFAHRVLDQSGTSSWNRLLKYQHRCGPNLGKPVKAILAQTGFDLQIYRDEPNLARKNRVLEWLKGLRPEKVR